MRDGSVTDRVCAACGGPLPDADPRRRFCSGACRMQAHRARRVGPAAPVPIAGAMPVRVYECPGCGERHLDERRCPECKLFCRSLGPGGECPCCGEAVALAELVGAGDPVSESVEGVDPMPGGGVRLANAGPDIEAPRAGNSR